MKHEKQALTIYAEKLPTFWHCAIYPNGSDKFIHTAQVQADTEEEAKERAYQDYLQEME